MKPTEWQDSTRRGRGNRLQEPRNGQVRRELRLTQGSPMYVPSGQPLPFAHKFGSVSPTNLWTYSILTKDEVKMTKDEVKKTAEYLFTHSYK